MAVGPVPSSSTAGSIIASSMANNDSCKSFLKLIRNKKTILKSSCVNRLHIVKTLLISLLQSAIFQVSFFITY